MKTNLSWALTLLGIAMLVLSVYQFNQYLVQQATVKPSLEQLEQLGSGNLGGVDLQQTRALIEASSTAMIQSIVLDLILGLLFLAGGFWLAPKDAHHVHAQ
ncbi:hypothetical protein HYV43_04055 [Candidatus Micrarchaeota archaeon]|nr:hypothetical protein [Candidatus Micrarchaeota archaeon]